MDKLTAQKILGVSPGASKKEIKKAYAAMLRMYHPEDYPQEFQRIQEAYEVLIKGNGDGGGFWEEKEADMETGVPQERQEESQNQESGSGTEKSSQQEKEEEPDTEEPGQQEQGASELGRIGAGGIFPPGRRQLGNLETTAGRGASQGRRGKKEVSERGSPQSTAAGRAVPQGQTGRRTEKGPGENRL